VTGEGKPLNDAVPLSGDCKGADVSTRSKVDSREMNLEETLRRPL